MAPAHTTNANHDVVVIDSGVDAYTAPIHLLKGFLL
jgi:hypothetical protein